MTTFVYTDLQDSTVFWEREPEPMVPAMARHDELIESAVGAAGGVVVKHTGDGILSAFGDAAAGVRAAVAMQRGLAEVAWPTSLPLRVRIGVHTGRATPHKGDYYGVEVARAARVMDAGHGGQVLVSGPAWSAASGVDPEVGVLALGPHVLKGLREPEELLQVVAPGLGREFPPLRAASLAVHNLPPERTPFIGREGDLERVAAALGAATVVTLAGPGGVGKSRLARAVGRERLGRDRDGVFTVDLGALDDPDLLTGRVAAVVDMPTGGEPVDRPTLVAYLAPRSLLLILNDVEHLADAVADFVDDLLAAAPALRLLLTSREALGVPGEQVVTVDPLPVDDRDPTGGPAVRLFLDRVAAAGADPDEIAVADVVALCRRLDGLPLAIELAAASGAHLAPAEILAQLDAGVGLGGRRRTGGRWGSLDETLGWSYDRLDPPLQAAFRAVSVFQGEFSADRAAAVLGDGVDAVAATRLLAGLAATSLLTRHRHEGVPVHRLLGVVRDFAHGRAVEAGDAALLAERHRDRLLAEAESVDWPRRTNSTRWALALERSLDDHRAALDQATAAGRLDLVARHLSSLCGLWWVLPHADEGRERFDRLGQPDDPALAAATAMAGAAASIGGDDFVRSRELLDLAITRLDGRTLPIEPIVWGFRGVTELGRLDAGLALLDRGRVADTTSAWAPFLDHFEGDLRLMAGQVGEAHDAYDRALAAFDWDEYLWWATAGLSCQAAALHLRGEHDRSVEAGRAAVDLAAGEPRLLSTAGRAVVVAYPLAALGADAEAAELLVASLAAGREQQHLTWARGEALGGVAGLAHHRGDHDVAGTLLGFTADSGQAFRSPWQFALHVQYARQHEAVTGQAPDAAGAGIDEAVALAERYLATVGQ